MYFTFCFFFFFFNDTATTEIYTLSLHDALPISIRFGDGRRGRLYFGARPRAVRPRPARVRRTNCRSEEHTSELQSLAYLVCRLLLEKKKIYRSSPTSSFFVSRAECSTDRRAASS